MVQQKWSRNPWPRTNFINIFRLALCCRSLIRAPFSPKASREFRTVMMLTTFSIIAGESLSSPSLPSLPHPLPLPIMYAYRGSSSTLTQQKLCLRSSWGHGQSTLSQMESMMWKTMNGSQTVNPARQLQATEINESYRSKHMCIMSCCWLSILKSCIEKIMRHVSSWLSKFHRTQRAAKFYKI